MEQKNLFAPHPCFWGNEDSIPECCVCEKMANREQIKTHCIHFEEECDMGAWSPWCKFKGKTLTETDNCIECVHFENAYASIEMKLKNGGR